ncbi:unnamed protein product, partial [Discosporangium mesarthrocarpum]
MEGRSSRRCSGQEIPTTPTRKHGSPERVPNDLLLIIDVQSPFGKIEELYVHRGTSLLRLAEDFLIRHDLGHQYSEAVAAHIKAKALETGFHVDPDDRCWDPTSCAHPPADPPAPGANNSNPLCGAQTQILQAMGNPHNVPSKWNDKGGVQEGWVKPEGGDRDESLPIPSSMAKASRQTLFQNAASWQEGWVTAGSEKWRSGRGACSIEDMPSSDISGLKQRDEGLEAECTGDMQSRYAPSPSTVSVETPPPRLRPGTHQPPDNRGRPAICTTPDSSSSGGGNDRGQAGSPHSGRDGAASLGYACEATRRWQNPASLSPGVHAARAPAPGARYVTPGRCRASATGTPETPETPEAPMTPAPPEPPPRLADAFEGYASEEEVYRRVRASWSGPLGADRVAPGPELGLWQGGGSAARQP